MNRKLGSRIEKLANYLAGPYFCEDAVGDTLDEDVGRDISELASGEGVDGNAFFF